MPGQNQTLEEIRAIHELSHNLIGDGDKCKVCNPEVDKEAEKVFLEHIDDLNKEVKRRMYPTQEEVRQRKNWIYRLREDKNE